jgi:glycosyltransferase involved in cell wall biosynthesis
MKKISIITPVWNRSDLTARWLLQNWSRYAGCAGIEWIIINNGSTDDTLQLLENCKKMMGDALKIISLENNVGFGPANNIGAVVSKGQILAFISNDVQVLGDYITPIKVAYRYDHGKVLFGPEIWENNTGWNTFDLGTIPYVAGWCVIVEKRHCGDLCASGMKGLFRAIMRILICHTK